MVKQSEKKCSQLPCCLPAGSGTQVLKAGATLTETTIKTLHSNFQDVEHYMEKYVTIKMKKSNIQM